MSAPDVAVSRSEARAGRLDAITNPGAVKINVQGAFIVDEEPQSRSKSPVEADGVHYESKDIRLPHHTGVVSHVAVDVSYYWLPSCSLAPPDISAIAAGYNLRTQEREKKRQRKTERQTKKLIVGDELTDWRVVGETGLFYSRAGLCG